MWVTSASVWMGLLSMIATVVSYSFITFGGVFPIRVILYAITWMFIIQIFCPIVCNDWDVRLVNGSTAPQPAGSSILQEGTVEVCFNNTYGSICHNLWNENDARVLCRDLGFSSENTTALINAHYGISSGPIYLNSIQCTGDETSLSDCSYVREIDGCTHEQDAGVSCLGIPYYEPSISLCSPCRGHTCTN